MPIIKEDIFGTVSESDESHYKCLAKKLVESVADLGSNPAYLIKAVDMNNLFIVELIREKLEGGVLSEKYISDVQKNFAKAHDFKEHKFVGEALEVLYTSCNNPPELLAIEYPTLGSDFSTMKDLG